VAPAAASAGPVDITVTNPGTTSATSAADLFYYASAAILTPAGFSSNVLPATDNGSTGSLALGFMVNFFGASYTQVFVNNNGNVTFDAQLADYLPYPIVSTIHPMIAPFFADVDTRVGQVVTYGQDMVNGHPAFGVDWVDVGYNNQNTDKTNIFQLVLISRADIAPGDFDVEFNYGQIAWETGESGSGKTGYGGTSARAGLTNGSGNPGTNIELNGSGVEGAFLDSNPATGLVNGSRNTGVPGSYLFTVRPGGGPLAPIIRPTVTAVQPASGPTSGGTTVTITGSNFTGAIDVYFGLTRASSFTVNSASKITARSPAHVAGTVDVRVVTATANSAPVAADRFTYTVQAGAGLAQPKVATSSSNTAPPAAGSSAASAPASPQVRSSRSLTSVPPAAAFVPPSGNVVEVAAQPTVPGTAAVVAGPGPVLLPASAGQPAAPQERVWPQHRLRTAWRDAELSARDAYFADESALADVLP
jgi:hypothetical protein